MHPLDLIETARRLADTGERRPYQSDLRRAVSTIYYALFHALCLNCADMLIGTTSARRSEYAWRQAYRSIQHSQARRRLNDAKKIQSFPEEIQDFGDFFATAQDKRHDADYDPYYRVAKSDVLIDAAEAKSLIDRFMDVPPKDKRALAAWVTLIDR